MGIASRLAKKLINGVDNLPVKDTSVQRTALRSNLDNSIENKHVSNLEFDARIEKLDEANTAEEWQKNTKEFVKKSRDVNPTVRTPELENSTLDLLNNKITRKQHLDNVDKHRPVNPWDALPIEPSNKATVFSLKPNQRKDGFFVLPEKEAKRLGVAKSLLAIGQRFLGRLDIPAYKDYDTWIIAGKAPKGEKGTVYAKAIHYTSEDGKPVIFRASQGKSENIGKGKADPNYHPDTHEKTGYATIDGIVKDLDTKTIRAKAEMYLNDPEWVQVGFDPRRQGGFYVRAGDNKHVPVREASEVIQIGPLVLAKNAKLDFAHTGYAEGGMAIAAKERSDNLKFNKGGTPMERQMELFNDGGLKDEGGMIDEVSGNDVPVGSTREEVRDDIPAMLSEGEFVFPADVVRYLGLNRLMQLRQEAKMGLKQMEAMGQMGNSEEAIIPDDLPFDVLEIMVTEEDDDDDEPQEKYQGGVLHAARGTFVTPTFDPSNQDVRKYTNADGKSLMIPFLNGNPVYPVPAGYLPEAATAETAPVEAPTQSSDDNDPPPPPPQSEFEKLGGWNMDTSGADGKALDLWLKEAEKITTTGNVVVGIIGAINPLIAGAMALAVKKQKKIIEGMLPEKLAQAKKTPIAGQVDTAESITKRLTTKKGKGIIATAAGSIVDTISDALGFGEEEKKKAKVISGTVAEQDPDESDDATKEAVKESIRPTARTAEAQTSGEYAAMQQMLAAKDEDTEPVVSESQLTGAGLDRFESDDARQTRAALGFPDPTVELSESDKTLEVFQPTDTEELKSKLTTDNAPAPMRTEMATVMNAKQDLRQTVADLRYDTSRDTAMSSLSGFGEDATSQAIKSYLEKTMDNVNTIVKGPDTPTVTPTAAPVQGGGDDDDGDPFADLKAQVAATQAQGQVLKDTNADVASASETYEANQAAEEENATSAAAAGATPGGPGGQYGMKTGGFVSKPSKKKKN
jgi:hypothetical protein